MLRKKDGFTLIELIVTLAIAAVALIAVFTLANAFYRSFSTTTELTNAQIDAHTTLKSIELKIRDANYLNIEERFSDSPNDNYSYIYNDEKFIKLHNVAGKTDISKQDSVFWEKISFSRVNDRVLRVTVSVYKNAELVYNLSANVSPNNLFSNNITGIAEGECISYQVNVSSFKSVSAISVLSSSAFIHNSGETMAFTAQITHEDASIQTVAWSVSDKTIARISQEGILTPLNNGLITVTAIAMDGSGIKGEKQILISNQKPVITDLKLGTSSGINELKKNGSTLTITSAITPDGVAHSENPSELLTWTVDDTSIATINENGVLTSKNISNRSVMITAKTIDGSNIEATIEIRIID